MLRVPYCDSDAGSGGETFTERKVSISLLTWYLSATREFIIVLWFFLVFFFHSPLQMLNGLVTASKLKVSGWCTAFSIK